MKLALNDGRLCSRSPIRIPAAPPRSSRSITRPAPLDIGFNARYLLDITGQLDGDTALFRLADPGSPTLIQDREASPALYVLMPMRV